MTLFPIALYLLSGVMIAMLLWAAWADVADRSIPDRACVALALCGAAIQIAAGPRALAISVAVALVLFLVLFALFCARAMGGGDVKLLVAAALGQTASGTLRMLFATALAGAVLVLIHLSLRHLPRPALVPAGSSSVRRVYAAERWRILRGAPLPYGVAIACGGIWTILTQYWS